MKGSKRRSAGCLALPGSAAACIGCAMPWPMSPKPSRAWRQLRCAKRSCSPTGPQASQMLRHVADRLRQKWPKLRRLDRRRRDRRAVLSRFPRAVSQQTAQHQPARTVKRRAGAVRDGDAALQGQDAADDHEVIVTFGELARTRTQRRESYLSPPNGLSVVLSLNSAGRSISEARRFPSCCS